MYIYPTKLGDFRANVGTCSSTMVRIWDITQWLYGDSIEICNILGNGCKWL